MFIAGKLVECNDAMIKYLLKRESLAELFRYCLVCGFAFLADFGTLILCREVFFDQVAWGVYAAVILGFTVGHVSNYILSLIFVFRKEEERRNGWTWKAFVLFTVVGAMGAGITELGMWIGYGCLGFNYILVKSVMAGIVVLWNFIGRKLIVSQGES